jgi:hypothetical protein
MGGVGGPWEFDSPLPHNRSSVTSVICGECLSWVREDANPVHDGCAHGFAHGVTLGRVGMKTERGEPRHSRLT